MAIYTGLLIKIQPTDDELAQVMGHEITHALENHTAERMSVALASAAGVVAVGVISNRPLVAMGATAAAATRLALHDTGDEDPPLVRRRRQLEHAPLAECDAQATSLAVALSNADLDGTRWCRPS